MATAAVFIALGGSSYAALVVTGKNVKNSSLTGRDVKNSSLTTLDVKNRSLLAADFKPGQLPAGAQGARGETGLKGDPGVSGYQQVDDVSAYDSTSPKSATAFCPAGTKVIGGGIYVNELSDSVATKTSVPLSDGDAWGVDAYETPATAGSWSVDARAICAHVAP
jgi:hypothetical protein